MTTRPVSCWRPAALPPYDSATPFNDIRAGVSSAGLSMPNRPPVRSRIVFHGWVPETFAPRSDCGTATTVGLVAIVGPCCSPDIPDSRAHSGLSGTHTAGRSGSLPCTALATASGVAVSTTNRTQSVELP